MNWAQRSILYALMSDERLTGIHHACRARLLEGEGMTFEDRETLKLVVMETGIEIDIRREFDRAPEAEHTHTPPAPRGSSRNPEQ